MGVCQVGSIVYSTLFAVCSLIMNAYHNRGKVHYKMAGFIYAQHLDKMWTVQKAPICLSA